MLTGKQHKYSKSTSDVKEIYVGLLSHLYYVKRKYCHRKRNRCTMEIFVKRSPEHNKWFRKNAYIYIDQ